MVVYGSILDFDLGLHKVLLQSENNIEVILLSVILPIIITSAITFFTARMKSKADRRITESKILYEKDILDSDIAKQIRDELRLDNESLRSRISELEKKYHKIAEAEKLCQEENKKIKEKLIIFENIIRRLGPDSNSNTFGMA